MSRKNMQQRYKEQYTENTTEENYTRIWMSSGCICSTLEEEDRIHHHC